MATTEKLKASDLRAKSVKELEIMRDERSQELMNLRFQRAVARLEKPHRIMKLKRERASILTVLTDKKSKEKAK